MIKNGGISKQSTVKNATTGDHARLLDRIEDEYCEKYWNNHNIEAFSEDTNTRRCSLCGNWTLYWIDIDILGDDEVYCIKCTGKGLKRK